MKATYRQQQIHGNLLPPAYLSKKGRYLSISLHFYRINFCFSFKVRFLDGIVYILSKMSQYEKYGFILADLGSVIRDRTKKVRVKSKPVRL